MASVWMGCSDACVVLSCPVLCRYERFIRPTALRFKKAHVTHPELQATFCLDILGVKKNPSSQMYTQLGVITKGTVIEVTHSLAL